MSENLTAAREALAEYDRPRCGGPCGRDRRDSCDRPREHAGRADESGCTVYDDGHHAAMEHLRAALAEVERLEAERDEARNALLRRHRGKRPKYADDNYDGVLDESIKACKILGIDIGGDYDYLGTLRRVVAERDQARRERDAARAEGRREGIEEVYAIVVGPDDARWRSIFGVDLTFKGKVGEYAEKTRNKARDAIRALLTKETP